MIKMINRDTNAAFGWLMAGLVGTTVLGSPARAQEATAQPGTARPAIRIGFHRGERFQNGASQTHLEGFELGADVPLQSGPDGRYGVYFSPTATFGGSNRKGADTDGNIYRLLINVKAGLGASGAYGGLGVGYSFSQARIHEFRNVSGVAGEAILGYGFGTPQPGRAQPFVEATYHKGAHSQLSGVSVDLGVRL